ncbi:TonB-dependent receptor [Sphingobacterium lactis]|uniref:TonB-linked outer membrane protein, SusC/RagA family n=1 Tax=Sphingobacterium lactis TaxID=797291 RepID=A0A1H5XRM1_9SPHI|nr:TonB-dependent receptor [Sphingobacterium lactis]SEG14302.1 TonB-linked outer membrane protein, SusC/RagA family [Sphingobacterium lactis]
MTKLSFRKCASNGRSHDFWKRKSNLLVALQCSFIIAGVSIQETYADVHTQTTVHAPQSIELDKMLKTIEKKTGYVFFYKSAEIKDVFVKQVDMDNKSVTETLNDLFAQTAFNYTIKGKTISIKRNARAQQTVTGTVKDATGKTLSGATVTVKGTNKATSTDVNGQFSIDATPTDMLTISSIGFETVEVSAGAGAALQNIVLSESSESMEELVVIGYGAVNRKNVSGAVSTVKGSDLAAVSTTSNFAQGLQGKAAGVQVMQPTGQPGASATVKIRNNPSNASAGVLYVVDGVPINGGATVPGTPVSTQGNQDVSPLNFINSNDIESIELLKDAASASIYGARAGAGVVLITTKRGKAGAPKIEYTGTYGFQKADKMYEVLDTRTYMEQVNKIGLERWMQNNKIGPFYGNVDASTVTPFKPRYTADQIANTPMMPNAMEAVHRDGYTTQHNISLSGGSDKTRYFVSGNYYDQKGVLLASGMKRYNFRANFDQNITDKIKTGISATLSDGKINTTGTGGSNELGGILTSALYHPANLPLRNPDGTYPINPQYPNIPSPLSYQDVTNDLNSFRLLTNAYLSWEIIDGLTAKGMYSYDRSTSGRNLYLPRTYLLGERTNGFAHISKNEAGIKLLEYTLAYNKRFGTDHSINGVLGYSYNQFKTNALSAGNQNFPTDAFLFYNLGAGQSPKPSVGSGSSEKTIASYFLRGIYTYKDRYTLQASLRRDGASNFAENKKWGYFPGVAFNWVISEEGFIKDAEGPVSFLKLRLSYGETGNSDIASAAQGAYSTSTTGIYYDYLFGDGTTPATGFGINRLANPNLSWETAREINAGLDFGFFNDRLTGSVDVYTKTIDGLLFNVVTPEPYQVKEQTVNAGKTRTDGFDIAIQTRNIVDNSGNNGFTWSTNINFSHYLSYWTERAPQTLATLARYIPATGKDALHRGAYGYISNGIYRGDGNVPAHMPNLLPGSLILEDRGSYDSQGNLAGPDGLISSADQTLLANLDPKFNFGFGNTFTYKNFDLNIFFSGAVMKAWSPYGPNQLFRIATLAASMGSFDWNTMPISLDRWSYDNTEANFPTGLSDPRYANFQNNSDYWMLNASFLRLRNVTLGYQVPATWLQGQKVIKGARLSFDVQNPWTITNYPGLDPELNQNNYYPLTSSYVMGINLSF